MYVSNNISDENYNVKFTFFVSKVKNETISPTNRLWSLLVFSIIDAIDPVLVLLIFYCNWHSLPTL